MDDYFDGEDFDDDEFTDDDFNLFHEAEEENSPDEEYDLDWEDIAFLGGMSEEIAEEERGRRRLDGRIKSGNQVMMVNEWLEPENLSAFGKAKPLNRKRVDQASQGQVFIWFIEKVT